MIGRFFFDFFSNLAKKVKMTCEKTAKIETKAIITVFSFSKMGIKGCGKRKEKLFYLCLPLAEPPLSDQDDTIKVNGRVINYLILSSYIRAKMLVLIRIFS